MKKSKRFEKTTFFLTLLLAVILFSSTFTAPVFAVDGEGPGKPGADPNTKKKQAEAFNKKDSTQDAMDAADGSKNTNGGTVGRWPDKSSSPEYNEAYDSGSGVHKDPKVFEQNFVLTPAQKEETITHIDDWVTKNLTSDMSDLEKYYMLALWENSNAIYDDTYWSGGYDFDYYKNQWDSYGVFLGEGHLSVCAGIAVTYAVICHAAGLPCKFVRCDKYLDHTLNWIPDINGKSYYIDVTENSFFMSGKNDWSFEPIDLTFGEIPENKRPSDGSFEFKEDKNDRSRIPANIKDFYDGKIGKGEKFKPKEYATWYNEFALHKNTKKVFYDKYVEKGSGTGTYHAEYANFAKYSPQPYASRKNGVTDYWFLNDFYKEPTIIERKVRDKEIDEQLLAIDALKENYDCDTEGKSAEEIAEALKAQISRDITSVKYFPTLENDKIVAKATGLENGTDYELSVEYNSETHEATVTITGKGNYKGKSEYTVTVNTATVTEDPIRKTHITYDGSAQELLVEPGKASYGTMVYALGDREGPTEEFSTAFPKRTDVGVYFIWYKAVGDENHFDSKLHRLLQPAVITGLTPIITVDGATLKVGDTYQLNPTLDVDLDVIYSYESSNTNVATVDKNGVVTAVSPGVTQISVIAKLKTSDPNYDEPLSAIVTIEVVAPDTAVLTFDPNGGVWKEGGKEVRTIEAEKGSEFIVIDAPKRKGYTFEYWEGSEYQPGDKYAVKGDHTFTAKWTKNKNVKTGDSSRHILWTLLLVTSFVSVALIVKLRRHGFR